MPEWLRIVLDELRTMIRFGAVGVAATVCHLTAAWVFLHLGVTTLAANILAFPMAFAVSFMGHYKFTFKSSLEPAQAARRFLLASLLGFALNNGLLGVLVVLTSLPPIFSITLALAGVPLLTFVLARAWAFSHLGDGHRE